MRHANEVSLVVTSCGRVDLLQRTITSFLQHNTYPIAQSILIEDSCDESVYDRVSSLFTNTFDTIIFNTSKLGQIKSIDTAYEKVETPYVFHCEEDWCFFRAGFMEDSFSILDNDRHIITVWLRDRNEFPPDRITPDSLVTKQGVTYHEIDAEASPDWHGFTFNPGLRRYADYQCIKPFEKIGNEYEINKLYYELGYRAAIAGNPAVEHTGRHHSVRKRQSGRYRRPRNWLQKRLGLNKQPKRD